jgi:hypothetical protein
MKEPSPIALYLAELRRRLRERRAAKRRILREIESHLLELAAEEERAGIPPTQAESRAIERLGPADALAQQFASEDSPDHPLRWIVSPRAASLAVLVVAAVAATVSAISDPRSAERIAAGPSSPAFLFDRVDREPSMHRAVAGSDESPRNALNGIVVTARPSGDTYVASNVTAKPPSTADLAAKTTAKAPTAHLAAPGTGPARSAQAAHPNGGCKIIYRNVRGRPHKKKVCHPGLPRGAFALELTRTNDSASVGNLVAYRLAVRSLGPDIAQKVLVDFAFNTPTSYAAALVSEGGVGSCGSHNPEADHLTCNLGNMIPSRQNGSPIVINLWVKATQPGPLTVEATVNARIHDRDPDAATVRDSVDVLAAQASADLSVSSQIAPDPVSAGSDFTDTIRITNTGPTEASRVFLTVLLPQRTQFLARDVSPGWKGDNACLPLTNFGTDYFTLCWDGIPSGQTITVTVKLKASDASPPRLEANAVVSAWTPDPDEANNRTAAAAASRKDA